MAVIVEDWVQEVGLVCLARVASRPVTTEDVVSGSGIFPTVFERHDQVAVDVVRRRRQTRPLGQFVKEVQREFFDVFERITAIKYHAIYSNTT